MTSSVSIRKSTRAISKDVENNYGMVLISWTNFLLDTSDELSRSLLFATGAAFSGFRPISDSVQLTNQLDSAVASMIESNKITIFRLDPYALSLYSRRERWKTPLLPPFLF